MKNSNCCKEKSVNYKVKDNQDSGNKSVSAQSPVKILNTNFYSSLTNSIKVNSALSFVADYGEPPDVYCSSVYIVNRVFRI